jgi:hypothetical protein
LPRLFFDDPSLLEVVIQTTISILYLFFCVIFIFLFRVANSSFSNCALAR